MPSTTGPSDPENWRQVAQSPYLVSKDGRLWSVLSGREIKTKVSKVGYQNVNLGHGVGTKFVHHLVAEAWIGPRPSRHHVIDHRDENRLNNSVDNLEWVTRKENTQRAVVSGKMATRRRGKKAYLSDEQVCDARRMIRNGATTFAALGAKYAVDPTTIRSAVYGVTYQHVDEPPVARVQQVFRPAAGGATHRGPLLMSDQHPADFIEVLDGERWQRMIGEFCGYWVSNMGRVFSAKTRRLKKPQMNSGAQGYMRVQLQSENGRPRGFMIHRLVADYFLPPPSHPDLIVGHLNENPQDARSSNLAWISRKENAQRAHIAKTRPAPVIEIQNFLSQHFTIERSRRIDDVVMDAFIPDRKLGVIFDDVKTTSELAGMSRLVRVQAQRKLAAQGIRLLRVFSNEWAAKPDLVRSMLLHRLGKTPNRVMARDTEVREVTSTVATAFLRENHLQGPVGSRVKLGCFHDGKLVAMATFGPQRYGKAEGYFELLRYANLRDHFVVGGFSKLLAHFRRNYEAKHLISFADARWSAGGMYESNGFKLVRTSNPNYFYFRPEDPDVLRSRVVFQKHKLPAILGAGFDPSKSEVENMLANGWDRIWDCGNLVYEMPLSAH